MKRLEIGKLYICEKQYIMLYHDRASAERVNVPCANFPEIATKYWSEELGKPVKYCDDMFMVLGHDDDLTKILFKDAIGWIITKEWMEIREMINATTG